MESNPSGSRADRKIIEKNRRNHMKALFSKLNSLVPHQSSGEVASLPDQLDEAASYIKKLQTNVERMKERKDSLTGVETGNARIGGAIEGSKSTKIEIHEMDSALQVVLITGLDNRFLFNETIRVLHEEGAEIVSAGFSAINDTVFHSIHAKVEKSATGSGAAKISERLTKFVDHTDHAF